METITFQNENYPLFQSKGFASKFAFPFALEVCVGRGVDVGCNREEWKLPGALAVDPALNKYDAMNLPKGPFDYIFSSHCLEHIPDWVRVLDYWIKNIKQSGTLFLYLPDFSQTYWRAWNNKKHLHAFTPEILRAYLEENIDLQNVFVSGVDLNNSFMCIAEKK